MQIQSEELSLATCIQYMEGPLLFFANMISWQEQ